MMFYIMLFMTHNDGMTKMPGSDSVISIMNMGTWVVGIFSAIFLFYTNSFLMKHRKKELALYNILGMEKKHIARVLLNETVYITLISLTAGILLGILMSKLMLLLLFKLLSFSVPFGFQISKVGIIITALLFLAIFLLSFFKNLFQIHLSNPIDLLMSSQAGEKEPKTKLIMTIIGVICLGIAYYVALTTESPLAAIFLFFIAVVLVIIGTYCLFAAGSITFLKALRKNKKYYYKTKHFTSVSGMLYRMKQNSVGLANICILSTAVLVMLSTTVSLYIGMEDTLRIRFPRNIVVSGTNISENQITKIEDIIQNETKKLGVAEQNTIHYRYNSFLGILEGSSFKYDEDANYYSSKACAIILIPLSEYNRMQNESKQLANGETMLYCARGDFKEDTVEFGNYKLKIKERIMSLETEGSQMSMIIDCYYFIVPDDPTIDKILKTLNVEQKGKGIEYFYGFDTDTDAQTQIALTKAIRSDIKGELINGASTEGMEASKSSFLSLYGGLLFLGIFLGSLFMMATVLIIYYKQISEGYDDKKRFEIMQKVGMSREEVKRTIRSQVLTVFFLPLVTAVIHIAFAFKVITKLLAVLNLMNVTLFAWCTVGTLLVFALFYAFIYSMTARSYYRIVR
jgi:putative ABC transport system permease protein